MLKTIISIGDYDLKVVRYFLYHALTVNEMENFPVVDCNYAWVNNMRELRH